MWANGRHSEETTRVIEKFQKTKSFPGCSCVIEAVDSSFIQIRAPKKDTASYIIMTFNRDVLALFAIDIHESSSIFN